MTVARSLLWVLYKAFFDGVKCESGTFSKVAGKEIPKYYIFRTNIRGCRTTVRQKRYRRQPWSLRGMGQQAGRFRMEPDTEKITIRIPQRHLRALDFLVEIDDFPSRSEAIRASIRDLIYARLELVVDRMKKFEHHEQSVGSSKQ